MKTEELSYLSSNGVDTIKASLWTEDANSPQAVLQIVHGMSEYIGRYERFASFMAENGFAVCGNDHLGHGRSAATPDRLGFFAPQNGADYLVEDVHLLFLRLKERFPGRPVFLLGHSMGSFITRSYITRYASGLSGYLCSGTAGPNPLGGVAARLAELEVRRLGPLGRSKFLHKLTFGGYNNRYCVKRTQYDWLTRDTEVVDRYEKDEWCNYVFTSSGFRDLFTLLNSVSQKSWAAKVPKELPIILIAGQQDPVGDFGNGPRYVYSRLLSQGVKDVTLRLFEDCRHEVLNELNRLQVYEEILEWIRLHLPTSTD